MWVMARAKIQLGLLFTRAVLCARRNFNLGFVLVLVCVLCFIFGSPLYWFSKDSSVQASCGSCDCDCSQETLFHIPPDFIDSPLYKDCDKQDLETREEMEKDRATLLAEELDLIKTVDSENTRRTKELIVHYEAASKAYRSECEKCIIEVRSGEDARERAEAEFAKELKITALWENRARQLGWTDDEEVEAHRV